MKVLAIYCIEYFCCRKSLAERLEAQEELSITGDKGNMGNKELTFSLKRVSNLQLFSRGDQHCSRGIKIYFFSLQKQVLVFHLSKFILQGNYEMLRHTFWLKKEITL